jgi:hypothetical protein
MDIAQSASYLAQHAAAIRALVQGISETQARMHPAPAAWSVVEVLSHLQDEEQEDFRARLDNTFRHPGTPWPGVEPEKWAGEGAYDERSMIESLEGFLRQRELSLDWLRSLPSPDWQASSLSARGSMMTAAEVLAAWVAHDILHMRQLVELRWALIQEALAPISLAYAGDW